MSQKFHTTDNSSFWHMVWPRFTKQTWFFIQRDPEISNWEHKIMRKVLIDVKSEGCFPTEFYNPGSFIVTTTIAIWWPWVECRFEWLHQKPRPHFILSVIITNEPLVMTNQNIFFCLFVCFVNCKCSHEKALRKFVFTLNQIPKKHKCVE